MRDALTAGDAKGKALIERFPKAREYPALEHLRKINGFDPVRCWRDVTIPVLFIYGGNDTQTRTTRSIARIQGQLRRVDGNYGILLFNRNGDALLRDDLNEFLAPRIQDGGKH